MPVINAPNAPVWSFVRLKLQKAHGSAYKGGLEHQELRFLRLAILKRRNASNTEIEEGLHALIVISTCELILVTILVFDGIVNHLEFSEQGITECVHKVFDGPELIILQSPAGSSRPESASVSIIAVT
jgi:hypothetical protein